MIGFSLWPTYDWVIYFRSRFDRVATSDRRSLNAESKRNSGGISGLGMSYLVWGRTWWYVIPSQCTHHINMRFVLIVLPGRLCMSYLHTQFFPPVYLILTWGPTLHVSHLYLMFVIFAAGDLYEVCPIWCDWGGSEALDFKMLNHLQNMFLLDFGGTSFLKLLPLDQGVHIKMFLNLKIFKSIEKTGLRSMSVNAIPQGWTLDIKILSFETFKGVHWRWIAMHLRN